MFVEVVCRRARDGDELEACADIAWDGDAPGAASAHFRTCERRNLIERIEVLLPSADLRYNLKS